MPALYIVVIWIILITSAAVIITLELRAGAKKKRDQLAKLEHDLATANKLLKEQIEKLSSVQDNSSFEKYAADIVSHIDRAVIIIDQEGIVRFINEFAKQFLDITAAVGMSYKDVFQLHIPGQNAMTDYFSAAFFGKAQRLPETIELVSRRGRYSVSGSIQPIMSGQSTDSVMFLFEDISDQAARVREEQAFFSAAAHELRSPMTIIRMTVSLLIDKFNEMPKEKMLEHLKRTDETTQHLVRLVNEFLNVSRIDQGRLEIKAEKFDMITLTDDVIKELEPLARERNLYIHHDNTAQERVVTGDKVKAADVISNLISNGLKYTVQGGLTITHSVEDSTMMTTVTDTGPGIPSESQSLLFKRFGQVGEARQLGTAKSTGLGLYIAKKLAQLMRGDVKLVKSEPGAGSTFAIWLPLG